MNFSRGGSRTAPTLKETVHLLKLCACYIPGITIPVLCIFLSSCAVVNKSVLQADYTARKANLVKEVIQGRRFSLVTYSRISEANKPLRVYIEGDGRAYSTGTRVSNNPTPKNPLALKLAAKDTYPNILYIARPYQYFKTNDIPKDASRYWTTHRFASEVVNDIREVITKIEDRYGINSVILIGYSGGGAIAELVAAGRKDVKFIITVAGNLDIDYHTRINKLEPLTGSLNPADYGDRVRLIPQIHFIGADDRIVTPDIAESFREKINPRSESFKIIKLRGFTHHYGWAENWNKLLSQYLNDSGLLDN